MRHLLQGSWSLLLQHCLPSPAPLSCIHRSSGRRSCFSPTFSRVGKLCRPDFWACHGPLALTSASPFSLPLFPEDVVSQFLLTVAAACWPVGTSCHVFGVVVLAFPGGLVKPGHHLLSVEVGPPWCQLPGRMCILGPHSLHLVCAVITLLGRLALKVRAGPFTGRTIGRVVGGG